MSALVFGPSFSGPPFSAHRLQGCVRGFHVHTPADDALKMGPENE